MAENPLWGVVRGEMNRCEEYGVTYTKTELGGQAVDVCIHGSRGRCMYGRIDCPGVISLNEWDRSIREAENKK